MNCVEMYLLACKTKYNFRFLPIIIADAVACKAPSDCGGRLFNGVTNEPLTAQEQGKVRKLMDVYRAAEEAAVVKHIPDGRCI